MLTSNRRRRQFFLFHCRCALENRSFFWTQRNMSSDNAKNLFRYFWAKKYSGQPCHYAMNILCLVRKHKSARSETARLCLWSASACSSMLGWLAWRFWCQQQLKMGFPVCLFYQATHRSHPLHARLGMSVVLDIQLNWVSDKHRSIVGSFCNVSWQIMHKTALVATALDNIFDRLVSFTNW